MCITHGVFLFCISENPFNGFFSLCINLLAQFCSPDALHDIQILFSNTSKGAKGSAIMFRLIQTAIENGLDPYKYLTWLLKTANTANLKNPDIVEKLLPWNAPEAYIAYQTRK